MTRTFAAIALVVFSPLAIQAQVAVDVAATRALAAEPVSAETEWRLDQIVRSLAAAPREPQTEALLRELAGRAPQVLVPFDEGPTHVPLVDVGAAARFVLKQWDGRDAREGFKSAVRAAGSDALEHYFAAGEAQRRGVLDAIAASPPATLLAWRDEALARFDDPGGDELAAALGLALGDATLLKRVITEGSAPVAQRLLRSRDARIDEHLAWSLLRAALTRPELASMALFRIAARADAKSTALVWASLAEPALGATAAAIIARDADRHDLTRLAEMLDSDAPLPLRQRAALALALSDDAEAQAIARAWSNK